MTHTNIASIGTAVDTIAVTIGGRFLELFSSHMYSSPNKAFEELISNSWDAKASNVYIGVPIELTADDAAIWVLDDGNSMDILGLHDLWSVAVSRKREKEEVDSRPQIGKFGIGKLATYLLAHELTYICKATDGKIRCVTMDYRLIDRGKTELHIDPIKLNVREIQQDELPDLLKMFKSIPDCDINSLILDCVPPPSISPEKFDQEFGADYLDSSLAKKTTWTLALLTSLKNSGKELQIGRIKRLLRTALPLNPSINIVFNGEALTPSKTDATPAKTWIIGPELGIQILTLKGIEYKVTSSEKPYPHATIEGIKGTITGQMCLYQERISGVKSDALSNSNGFFINVRGRVINLHDPYFGLENLSHSAWAKFRAAVRSDGLDNQIQVSRESLQDSEPLAIFRAFLRALFNKARSEHDNMANAAWSQPGEDLTKAWNAALVEPLREVVAEGLKSKDLPAFVTFSSTPERDFDEVLKDWNQAATDKPGSLLSEVTLNPLPPAESLISYDLESRKVIVNSNHPFARGHSETKEQKQLLQDFALVDLLTSTYMLHIGLDSALLDESRVFRDHIFRLIAQSTRRTGAQIAQLLIKATANAKGLELIVGDALEYLGFEVLRLGTKGEPEGVATAPTAPAPDDQPEEPPKPSTYKFTYDAKSSASGRSTTGNLHVAGLIRHKDKYKADHTLVVAPDYQDGALQEECKKHGVTPMKARDLARLLYLAAKAGPIDLRDFRTIFQHHDPGEVESWVDERFKRAKHRHRVPLNLVLEVLEEIGYKGPDPLNVNVIAHKINEKHSEAAVSRRQIISLFQGLQVLTNLVYTFKEDVFLATSPSKLGQAIKAQLSDLPYQFNMELDGLEKEVPDVFTDPAKAALKRKRST